MSSKNISLFLEGKLKGEELQNFYREIASNTELMEELTKEIINVQGKCEVKKLLDDAKIEAKKNKRVYLITSGEILKLAALLIILFSIAIIIRMIINNTPTAENEDEIVHSAVDSLPDSTKYTSESNFEEISEQKKQNDENNKADSSNKISEEKNALAYEESKKTYQYQEKISIRELAKQYYEPYESPTYRTDAENTLDDAIELYKKGQYEMSFQKLQQTLKNLKKEEDINRALFYQGLCLLHNAFKGAENKNSHLNSAKENFYSVYVTRQQGRPYEQAGWYLSLTLMALEEKKEATDVLRKIVRNKTYKYKYAETLLDEITNGEN